MMEKKEKKHKKDKKEKGKRVKVVSSLPLTFLSLALSVLSIEFHWAVSTVWYRSMSFSALKKDTTETARTRGILGEIKKRDGALKNPSILSYLVRVMSVVSFQTH